MKNTGNGSDELNSRGDSAANLCRQIPSWGENVRPVEYGSARSRYRRVWPSELAEMDKALAIVGGSFLAAAKLLDMDPQRFRNLVNYHPQLKSKWGRSRGRQPQLKLRLRFP